ncbi:MAG: hypothetical protein SPD11_02775 [Sphaerochaetaceae bacterium]|nr:hypothetical protein [Sphaerochaetaceae bacterium]
MATPLGKSGYLFSRIGLPIVVSCVYGLVIGSLFSLTDISFGTLFCLSSLSGVMSVISALLVVLCASNKVAGMALTKLCGFLLRGLPVPFLMGGEAQYLAGLLPSLWFSKYAVTGELPFAFETLAVSLLWGVLPGRRFSRKLFASRQHNVQEGCGLILRIAVWGFSAAFLSAPCFPLSHRIDFMGKVPPLLAIFACLLYNCSNRKIFEE